ncbi:lipoprotein insertase outer membrane protein LolB [Vibrio sagamiensis]|nr:lipoprotein insertase outer membrane protein LolB [Vibrio sagamiensis]PNQ70583.1 lipoprotein localization protein LolB [Vibrio agarivorans]
MTLRTFFILLFASTLLSGCSSLPESVTNVEWQKHQQELQNIEQYQVSGRLAYISPEQRQSLSFFWKHSPSFSQLTLTFGLGQTALKMTTTPQGTIIETMDDQVLTAKDANQLIHRLTGLHIPVEQMPDWLLGLPTMADSFQLSATHTLLKLDKSINNNEWDILYQRYADINWHQQIIPLPTKLKLRSSDTTIKIEINKWNLNS